MATEENGKEPAKKSSNPLLFFGIGCLVLLVILGILGSVVMKFFVKKAGVGLLQSAIEKKTGVKTNLQDLENGKMSFTDEKTGAKVDIGSGKIPDTFPKDFPVYPGAKVVSVLSGSEKGKNSGFWVAFSTADSVDKVSEFYKINLTKNGWETTANYASGDTSTLAVTKGKMSGSVSVTRATEAKETEIMVVLSEDTGSGNTGETPSAE